MGGKLLRSNPILPSGGRVSTLAEVLSWPEVQVIRAQMEDYLDVYEDQKVIIWDTDLYVRGNLLLDEKNYPSNGSVEMVSYFVIRGNLQVDGTILNEVGDYGIGLIVLGNVSAENVIFGGSQGIIDGNILLSGYGLSFYNHGTIISTGSVNARALITQDNEFPGTPVQGIQVLESGGEGEYALEKYLLPEFKNPDSADDDYPDIDLLISAILSGKTLIDEGVPKTKEEEIRKAAAAWKEGKEPTCEFSMRGFTGKKLPMQITELDCIEFLDVSGTKCSYPSALGKLTLLRTLVAKDMDMKLLSGALAALPHLRELDMEGAYSITSPKVLAALSNLRGLQVLRVKDATSELLKLFPNLEILETRSMKTAEFSPRLRELKLLGAKRIPQKVDKLAGTLEVFEFRQDPWEKPDPKKTPVPTFSKFSKLRSVTLYGSYNLKRGMQVRYLQSLFDSPKLRTLNLVGWNCSLSEFKGIEKLNSLRALDLAEAELRGPPKGLEKLTNLRTLNLQGNLLRATAKKALSKALPNTQILFEKGQSPVGNSPFSLNDGSLLKGKKLKSFSDKLGRGANSYLGQHKLDKSKSPVLCFDGSLKVEGDLDLSLINDASNIAIAGDLVVSGDIIANTGTLVVAGTTEANHIITQGGELFFHGSVDASWILVLGTRANIQAHQPMAADSCLVDVGEEKAKLGISDFACDTLLVVSPHVYALDQQGSLVGKRIQGVGRVLSIVQSYLLNSSGTLDHDAVVDAVRQDRVFFLDAPSRPKQVPAAANWNPLSFQWELGEASLVNSENDAQKGSFSQWRLPGGYLAMRILCIQVGKELQRVEETFHPDGELAESTTWLGDHKSQEIYNRTEGELADGFCIPYYYNYDPEVRRVTANFPKGAPKEVSYQYWPS